MSTERIIKRSKRAARAKQKLDHQEKVVVTAADRIKAEQEGYVIDPWALIEENVIRPA